MAEVYDRWHLSRPRKGAEPCTEHSSRTRTLVPSSEHGQGKRWQVRYRDADGEQRKENFEKKAAADARAAEVETDLNRGQHIDRAAGRETFRSRAEDWRTSAIHRERTEGRVERTLRLHLYPTFGSRGIASVKRSEVQTWVKSQASRYEATTVGSHFEVLSTVMRMAVLDGVIRVNPCEGVKLPEKRSNLVIPHPLAVQALIEAAPVRYRALVRLAASSGLRQGEPFGLEEGLDFLRRKVEASQQLVTPDRGPQYLGPLKTPESYREVPLAPSAVTAVSLHMTEFPPAVSLHMTEFPPAAVEIEDRTDPLATKTRAARLVFTDEHGRPIRRSTWSRVWKAIKEAANKALDVRYAEAHAKWERLGKPEGTEPARVRVPEKCTLHSLGDFYASCLIEKNASVKVVQVRLGHSKPSITLDKYTGLWPTGEDMTADATESVLGEIPQQRASEPSALVVPSQPGRGVRSLS
ncbi:tyrosine-type recombinase/integrase [Streptomyces sp. NPDC126514]|uniref:tyrosine-type recombinase/integrase n=1 Tax=Streptomyces sp. NPDC126514 TaxID=3155210 RepID=UPI0033254E4D